MACPDTRRPWPLVALLLVAGPHPLLVAQSHSHADVQFGAVFSAYERTHEVAPLAVVLGATGWITDNSGIAVRVNMSPSYEEFASEDIVDRKRNRGVEITYRRRGVLRGLELDFGVGVRNEVVEVDRLSMQMRSPMFGKERVARLRFLVMDVLVGRRVSKWFSLRVGLSCGTLSEVGPDLAAKVVAIVPLGRR